MFNNYSTDGIFPAILIKVALLKSLQNQKHDNKAALYVNNMQLKVKYNMI